MVKFKDVEADLDHRAWICSTARGGMRVSVHQGSWSKAINLENLGLHYSFHVLGPPQAVGRAHQALGGQNESIMHFDCERTIAPRGFSPRKGYVFSTEFDAFAAIQLIETLTLGVSSGYM